MKLEDYINNRGISIKNGTIWVVLFYVKRGKIWYNVSLRTTFTQEFE